MLRAYSVPQDVLEIMHFRELACAKGLSANTKAAHLERLSVHQLVALPGIEPGF